ncbi:MAG TPA: bifunctional methylenetetrahydrofolate dehydrogenase/methenyltetrahydrofolate cyclohydrolase FolD [Syntrophaceae bacterium]|jgi:methylenetetrahydrofolate dehydrogenase (NADP+)/methenyltetrahydrofolate cyclohydrolase|nr:bifunctional methylenetetrahydrofolate dehydrogenase/methenyltetrahydrofolate cyclohydrolase FolD [Syntrophaceae bacterium]
MAVIIDGKKMAQEIRHVLKVKGTRLKQETGITPGLGVILVGEDPASQIYLRHKENACKDVGFYSREFRLPQETLESALLSVIQELNQDTRIHGILVQLPLPRHLNSATIIEAINPQKDVDGFHPYNLGRLFTGNPFHMACTPKGILELMDRHGIIIEGKEAVIVGRSNIVGKPLSLMLLNRHATVTICHTRTRHLPEITKRAEILVAAAGAPEMIRGDMVRDGAVIIDVGVNRMKDGRLVGDVAYSEVAVKASYVTPVPGGVGPMTIAMLLVNTLEAAVRSLESSIVL